MIGIYKITNLINKKSYIGQSVHIHRRWYEHKKSSSHSAISSAIKKYGEENFSFEILEKCTIEELNEKEQYWIQYYNTITPNGYNIAEDTQSIHTVYKSTDKQMILNIINDIKTSNATFTDIAERYNISKSTISKINNGVIHIQENETYPLRKTRNNNKENFCVDCGKKISRGSKRCIPCENLFRTNFDLPVSRDQLKKLIRTMPFTGIGKQFQVSDNAIRKWCDKYNLPKKVSDIKKISDEQWENI